MRILPYLCPCCGVLAGRFSNLTKFEDSHKRDALTYTHDIFNNKCKSPYHATQKISNLYIENKYHHLTSKIKFRLFLNKDVQRWIPYGKANKLTQNMLKSVAKCGRYCRFSKKFGIIKLRKYNHYHKTLREWIRPFSKCRPQKMTPMGAEYGIISVHLTLLAIWKQPPMEWILQSKLF